MKVILYLIVLVIGNHVAAQNPMYGLVPEKDTDSMLFLTYYVKHVPETGLSIKHLKTIYAKGRIKDFNQNLSLHKNGNLICTLRNEQQQIITTLYIKNPLIKSVEFVNNTGQLQKRLIEQTNTDFTFRIPVTKEVKFVTMGHITNQTIQTLSTIKL
ncbi:hypothetical protein ACFSQP_08385 [Bizionia sediminis]|uniref:DUF4251 domain-containing protein n=1 Tax=Bizionia sediminis TaxID=1737064 RepID=A0ABW5KS45_9FLAO